VLGTFTHYEAVGVADGGTEVTDGVGEPDGEADPVGDGDDVGLGVADGLGVGVSVANAIESERTALA